MSARNKPETASSSITAGLVKNSIFQQNTRDSTATITTKKITSEKKESVEGIVRELLDVFDKLDLTDEQRSKVQADAETVQSQLKKKQPKSSIIMDCLRSIRTTLQGAAGAAVGVKSLIEKISGFLGSGG
jgi:hypothetical protein